MSKTGTYKYINGEVVKVSDRIPALRTPVWFPRDNHAGYFSENCDVQFQSKDHKRQWLKEHKIKEAG